MGGLLGGTSNVLEESRAQAMAGAFGAGPDGGNAIQEWFAALPADQYPSLVSLAPKLTESDPDTRFEFGAKVLLDGLAHYLTPE